MMPALWVTEGPTMSGVRTRVESWPNFASTCSSGSSTRYPCTRGKRISQASRSGVMARTGTVSRGLGCLAATGWAVKSNGMPSTSAYSTLNRPSFVQIVGLAAQGAAHHLLAQKLGAERAHSEDVG